MDVVRSAWNLVYCANPLIHTYLQLKVTRRALSAWSKQEFRDIFKEACSAEAKVKSAEDAFIAVDSEVNRVALNRATALLKQNYLGSLYGN